MTPDPRLERWVEALRTTPGLTGLDEREAIWRVHVEESLAGLAHVRSRRVAP